MTVLDLTKATIVCGSIAFLVYSFPIIIQIGTIALLSALWLSYAHKTVQTIRAKRTA